MDWISLYSFPQPLSTDRFSFVHPLCGQPPSSVVFTMAPWWPMGLVGLPKWRGWSQSFKYRCCWPPIWIMNVYVLNWDTCQLNQVGNWNLDSWYKMQNHPVSFRLHDHPTFFCYPGGQALWTCDLAIGLCWRKWFVLIPPSVINNMAPPKSVVGGWNFILGWLVRGMVMNFTEFELNSHWQRGVGT